MAGAGGQRCGADAVGAKRAHPVCRDLQQACPVSPPPTGTGPWRSCPHCAPLEYGPHVGAAQPCQVIHATASRCLCKGTAMAYLLVLWPCYRPLTPCATLLVCSSRKRGPAPRHVPSRGRLQGMQQLSRPGLALQLASCNPAALLQLGMPCRTVHAAALAHQGPVLGPLFNQPWACRLATGHNAVPTSRARLAQRALQAPKHRPQH